jgi:CheY-like chemotaxis protein
MRTTPPPSPTPDRLPCQVTPKPGGPSSRPRTLAEASALASGQHCDLLVGDLQFPDGSGLDLMRDLRARYGLRGIAVSGYTAVQDVEAALAAGFACHLPKPITFPDLLAAVRELTADRATGTRGRNEPGRPDGSLAMPRG